MAPQPDRSERSAVSSTCGHPRQPAPEGAHVDILPCATPGCREGFNGPDLHLAIMPDQTNYWLEDADVLPVPLAVREAVFRRREFRNQQTRATWFMWERA